MLRFMVVAILMAPITERARAEPSSPATMDTVREESLRLAPCGEFVGTGGKWKMFGKMTFSDGNVVVGDVDGLIVRWPYFIADGRVVLRTDKAYFTLKIEKPDRMRGLDEWTEGHTYRRTKSSTKKCRAPDPEAVAMEFCHFTGVQLKSKLQHLQAIEQFRVCCDHGHADSCNQQGLLVELVKRDDRAAATLYEQACSRGSGGGCGNLAHRAKEAGNKDEAKRLYDRACKLGHKDSCLALLDL